MKYKIKKTQDGHQVIRNDGRIVSTCIGENSEDLVKEAIRRDKLFPQTAGRKVLIPTPERIQKAKETTKIEIK